MSQYISFSSHSSQPVGQHIILPGTCSGYTSTVAAVIQSCQMKARLLQIWIVSEVRVYVGAMQGWERLLIENIPFLVPGQFSLTQCHEWHMSDTHEWLVNTAFQATVRTTQGRTFCCNCYHWSLTVAYICMYNILLAMWLSSVEAIGEGGQRPLPFPCTKLLGTPCPYHVHTCM